MRIYRRQTLWSPERTCHPRSTDPRQLHTRRINVSVVLREHNDIRGADQVIFSKHRNTKLFIHLVLETLSGMGPQARQSSHSSANSSTPCWRHHRDLFALCFQDDADWSLSDLPLFCIIVLVSLIATCWSRMAHSPSSNALRIFPPGSPYPP